MEVLRAEKTYARGEPRGEGRYAREEEQKDGTLLRIARPASASQSPIASMLKGLKGLRSGKCCLFTAPAA